jgi:O-methyltransferase involved in polyketide biosynthesis
MKDAQIEADWIHYIPVDFKEESWDKKLIENDFDKSKTTYFHWESVSLYLEECVVRDTLRKLSDMSTSGGILALDFYSEEWIRKLKSMGIYKIQESIGELLHFGIDMTGDTETVIRTLLNEFGFNLIECTLAGHKTESGLPFYALALAIKA